MPAEQYRSQLSATLPDELWLGKVAGRNDTTIEVVETSPLAAIVWVKSSNPFVEERHVWRVSLTVLEHNQSVAAVKSWSTDDD